MQSPPSCFSLFKFIWPMAMCSPSPCAMLDEYLATPRHTRPPQHFFPSTARTRHHR